MAITSAMRTQVAELYVSLFGRAPESDGLGYWVTRLGNGESATSIAQEMFNATASRTYYPSFLTTDEIVGRFYTNVLGRTADTEGLAFWTAKLSAKGATVGGVVLELIQAVKTYAGTDEAALASKALLANKVDAALYYSVTLGGNSATNTALSGVTATSTSTTIHAAIDAVVTPPVVVASQTFALTTSADTKTLGTVNDTFTATATTFSAGDSLDGGTGNDTLAITDNVAAMNIAVPSATLTSVEKVTIATTGAIGVAAVTGVTGTVAVKEVDTWTIAAGATDTFTVTYNGIALTSAAVADANAGATAIAALINAAAGATIATAVNANIIVQAAVGGTALPTYTVLNNDESATAAVSAKVDSIANAAAVAAVTNVAATAYDLSGFASVTDVTATAAGAVNMKVSATTNADVTTTSGGVTLNGGLTQKVSAAGGYTVSNGKGSIVVVDSAQAAVASTVNGGTSVSITSTASNAGGTTGAITVGGVTKPTGSITIADTISEAKGTTNTTAGTITVSGGTVIDITQTATKALQTTAAANGTITSAPVVVTGSAVTTSVSVKGTAAVTAVNTVLAVAAVTEVETLTFAALAVGETQILNGLTFTAGAAGTTAAQTAAAFANLTSGSVQGNSTKGTYSGTFTAGWTSGAVTDTSKVVFTGTTAAAKTDLADTGTGTDPTVVVTTAGVDLVEATGKVGVTANTVSITDVNTASTTSAGTITSATAENYTSFGFNGTALSTLNLKNGSSNIIIDNSGLTTPTNKTLNLTVDGLTGGTLDDADIYTTLNVTTKYTGTSTTTTSTLTNVTFGALTALNVSGDKVLVLTSTAGASALVNVKVTGSAGLTGTFAATTMKNIDTSGTTGKATVTFDATVASYTGGAGVDAVTTSAAAPTEVISLGDGDDSLTLATGTNAVTGAITGGNGNDILSMVVADAAVADNDLAFSALVTGFEKLTLTGSTGAQAVVLSNLGLTSDITVATGSGTTTLTDFANAGKLTLTGDRAGDGVTISNAAFATPTTNSINVVMTATAGFNGGTVTAANVETVNLTATDTLTTATAHTLIVTANKAATLNVTGNAGVALTLTGSVLLATLDATASTGAVTATAVSTAAITMNGGSGADQFTATTGTNADVLNGNGGADILTSNAGLTVLTGGLGNDTFVVATNTSNVGIYTTITDFSAGDRLKLANMGTETFTTTKLALADTATFLDFLNLAAAGDGSTDGAISWFQYGGNTYVVEDMTAGATFTSATDLVVKLTGLIDLSVASLNTGSGPTIGF